MKQKVKKKRKVFRILLRNTQRSNKPIENDHNHPHKGAKAKDEPHSPCSFSAGE